MTTGGSTRYTEKDLRRLARDGARFHAEAVYRMKRVRVESWYIEFTAGRSYMAMVVRGSVKPKGALDRTHFTTSVAI